ncbi:MAG TPA: 30S ribosomal protein S13 [bacterium]|nr:30S ribosomal protein S13 [bacterium]
MPRIMGVDIPKEKKIHVSLCYIYGIGPTMAQRILTLAGIEPNRRAKDLKEEEIYKITDAIPKVCSVEGDVRRDIAQNVKRLIQIGCYRGQRHKKNLPVRGQRTHTNARTRKGPRQTVGVARGASKAAAPAPKAPAAAAPKAEAKK